MDDTPQPELPANLQFLRVLVTVLTVVMIVGVVVVVGLLVTRLKSRPSPISLPAEITLPDGSRPQAFTQAADWYAVVTDTNTILIYSRATNALVQTVPVTLPSQ